MSIRNLIYGYKYTTSIVIQYGDVKELKKLARAENKKFKRQRRPDRCIVYPVPGLVPGIGQLCILR